MNAYVMVALAAFGIGLVTGKLIYQQPPQLVAVPAIAAVPEEYLAPVSTGSTGIAEGAVQQQPAAAATSLSEQFLPSTETTAEFSCDGRTMCSQMNSRAEAEFFNQNCPNTKMDGNNDGEPCESDSRW